MATRQEDTPIYEEHTITLTADQIYSFNKTCRRVNIIAVTGSIGIRINEGAISTCRGGIGFAVPPGQMITRVELLELASAAASVTLAFSNGDIQDNRASFAGDQTIKNAAAPDDELQVKTKAGTELDCALAAADPGIAALIAALREDTLLRRPLLTLDGATFASHNNASGTLVASGTNTAGIIVRRAWSYTSQLQYAANYAINDGSTKPFVGQDGNGSSSSTLNIDVVENLHIPSGVALEYNFNSSAQSVGQIWYEVLT